MGRILAYNGAMQTLPLAKVRDKLSELVDAASVTREQVVITKNGTPVAVLIGADEWESIQETLFWPVQMAPAMGDWVTVAEPTATTTRRAVRCSTTGSPSTRRTSSCGSSRAGPTNTFARVTRAVWSG